MVILEGMLHGIAIAASAVGGPMEILDHERTGLLFPARDSKALAEAILQLVRDPDHRLRIAAAGARKVREKWLWHRIIEKMQRVYHELIPSAEMFLFHDKEYSLVPSQPQRDAARREI